MAQVKKLILPVFCPQIRVGPNKNGNGTWLVSANAAFFGRNMP